MCPPQICPLSANLSILYHRQSSDKQIVVSCVCRLKFYSVHTREGDLVFTQVGLKLMALQWLKQRISACRVEHVCTVPKTETTAQYNMIAQKDKSGGQENCCLSNSLQKAMRQIHTCSSSHFHYGRMGWELSVFGIVTILCIFVMELKTGDTFVRDMFIDDD